MPRRSSRPLTPDLAEAAEHFAHWPRTRSTSSAPTPQPLRERAAALLAAHRPSTVADALGINTVMLKRWSTPPSPNEPSGTPSPFVRLPEAAPEPIGAASRWRRAGFSRRRAYVPDKRPMSESRNASDRRVMD